MDTQSDFIPVAELARRTGYDPKTFYNQHSRGDGPFAGILTKLGGRLGCWRDDYEAFVARARRLKCES